MIHRRTFLKTVAAWFAAVLSPFAAAGRGADVVTATSERAAEPTLKKLTCEYTYYSEGDAAERSVGRAPLQGAYYDPKMRVYWCFFQDPYFERPTNVFEYRILDKDDRTIHHEVLRPRVWVMAGQWLALSWSITRLDADLRRLSL